MALDLLCLAMPCLALPCMKLQSTCVSIVMCIACCAQNQQADDVQYVTGTVFVYDFFNEESVKHVAVMLLLFLHVFSTNNRGVCG
jgi:hypothetical protein